MKRLSILPFAVLLFILLGYQPKPKETAKRTFTVSFSDAFGIKKLDGRLLLMLSTNDKAEPRFQMGIGLNDQLIFGQNVDGLSPDKQVVFDGSVFGFPLESIDVLPPGDYYVQALLNIYETFHLATGHTVKLPMDNGEGQHWNTSPGNIYSKPVKITISGKGDENFNIVMDQVIPEIKGPEDTQWVKHIKMRSEKLSKFWGRDIYLGVHILLPKGFDEHPEARYPLMVFHGHFPYDFGGFRTIPPDKALEPDYSERFHKEGYNIIQQQEAYDFYKRWNDPDFPRFLIIEIQHPTPYYDDSYAVNSANQGPYGDAITYELIPFIEKQFRGIGQGWARFLYGGSTGGWEALAVQVLYPDEYNGCFAACPDPVTFENYCLVNIYDDDNAYYYKSEHRKLERPSRRNYLGDIFATMKEDNHYEMVLGDKSRSGQQWDIWEATYSPQGTDGYPQRIWDKRTGTINKEVAAYWKEHYDLKHILQRDWSKLGPKLRGKIHIYCGDMDTYYLNDAVYNMEQFLENTTDPYYEGEVDYGDRAEHCWNGDHENPNYISRLRYNTMYVPKIMKRMEQSAPEGADLTSWRYR
ncbi:MAG: hypothetical protein KDC69_03080 [Flavobacteriaceae bacterium]|nr:hypothetical protein [Flavobacteriaceae bacterium]